MTTLGSLPTELVDAVCEYLDQHEILELRCTNRQLYSALWKTFAKLITSIKIIVHPVSLEKLEWLTTYEHLASTVEELVIGSEGPDQYAQIAKKPFPDLIKERISQLYINGNINDGAKNAEGVETLRDIESARLLQCIESLPNLKRILVEDPPRTINDGMQEHFMKTHEKHRAYAGATEIGTELRIFTNWNGPYLWSQKQDKPIRIPYAGRIHTFAVAMKVLRKLNEGQEGPDLHLILRSRNVSNPRRVETSLFSPPFAWSTSVPFLSTCVKSLHLETESLQDWESNLLRWLLNGRLDSLTLSGLHKASASGNGYLDHQQAHALSPGTALGPPIVPRLKKLVLKQNIFEHHENMEIFSYVFRHHGATLETLHFEDFAIVEARWDSVLRWIGELENIAQLTMKNVFIIRRHEGGSRDYSEEDFVKDVQWNGKAKIAKGCNFAATGIAGNGVLQPAWSRNDHHYFFMNLKSANDAANADG
ncbi:hypothetical protein EJ04DRAFT_564471 [Polyplosphaeria fusca]|uniref:F-box domain-containing protein n=1 Tax=Polyplosphaeria fusca TaxID=682080 RepID=A0A9P4V2E6_9PLEO|nr:hypothetical protein EJ04DRAFT_564471 [Polyplosphaeria fusca]